VHLVAWGVYVVITIAAWRALARLAAPRGMAADTPRDPWSALFARLWEQRDGRMAIGVLIALIGLAALAPWLAPYSPIAQPDIVALHNLPPSLAHPFGTDFASRDVLSRVMYGARVSLPVALLAVVVSTTVGTLYGAIAGFAGGRADAIMMRVIDAALAIPRLLLLIAILVLWGAVGVPALILLLGLTGWFAVSRLVRAEVLALRDRDMVVAARALGARNSAIIRRHILPNVLSPVIVAATLGVANVILIEAGLSYLGIGVRPPAASWGNIIQDGADQIGTLWWVSLFPGAAIVITVAAFNVVGDRLRDALDPRQLDGS